MTKGGPRNDHWLGLVEVSRFILEAIFLTCVLRPLLFLSFFTSICLAWGCCNSKLCHALRDIEREVVKSRGTGDKTSCTNTACVIHAMQSCCEYNGHPTAQRTKKMDSVNRHTARERPVSSKERTKSPWNQKSITMCDKHSRSFSTSPFCSLQSDKLAIYTRQVLLNHKTSLLILSQLLNSHSYHFCFCPTPVSSS